MRQKDTDHMHLVVPVFRKNRRVTKGPVRDLWLFQFLYTLEQTKCRERSEMMWEGLNYQCLTNAVCISTM